MNRPWRAALVAAAVGALVTIPGLGNGTLWDNSETAYGEVAREILLTHDWIVMHWNAAPWFVQPPLYFWIAAIFAKIFGVTSFALRLPSALATVAMGGLTAYALTRQTSTRAGLYAGIVLSCSLMQAIVGRLAIMDAMLDLAIALTIFWWFRALQTGQDRYFVYGWIAAGFGFLAKGPVAPVVALIVVVPYALWEARAAGVQLPSWRGWLGGLALFVAVVAPWFGALVSRTGLHSVIVLIGHYTFGRYTGTIENQSGPLWYYVPVLILGFFPWIAFLPSSIAAAARRMRDVAPEQTDSNAQSMARLALVWIVVPFLFFSFANTKLPNYIALEFPALAVIVALYFDRAVERMQSPSMLISAAAVPMTILFLALAIVVFSRNNRLTGDLHGMSFDLMYVGAAVFIGSLLAFVLLAAGRERSATPYILGASMVVAVSFIALLALPRAEAFKPIPKFARAIDEGRRPGDAVAIAGVAGGNALIFYTAPGVYTMKAPYTPYGPICDAQRLWLVAPRGADPPSYGRTLRLVAQDGKAALYLYAGPRCAQRA